MINAVEKNRTVTDVAGNEATRKRKQKETPHRAPYVQCRVQSVNQRGRNQKFSNEKCV